MSLKEILDAIRDLTEDEREKVRDLIDSLGSEERADRFDRLRGSLEIERLESISLEGFKTTRREVWNDLTN
ncbi:MAG: hypothetical protein AB7V18_11110 [Pyrinomonadaceae bacterium]